MLKFALAQCNAHNGNLQHNLELAINACIEASNNKAHVIIFPELFLTGYTPQDLLYHECFIAESKKTLELLVKASLNYSWNLHIIIGHINVNDKKIYNSAFVIHKGNIVYTYNKRHLPNDGIFDEKRYFHSDQFNDNLNLQNIQNIQKKEYLKFNDENITININLLICQDIWHIDEDSKSNTADINICINASPFTTEKQQQRLNVTKLHAKNTIYVNMIGGQDNTVFDGSSFVMSKDGNVVLQASSFISEINYIEYSALKKSWINFKNSNINNTNNNNMYADIYNALTLSLRDYVYKSGFKKVVLGLSGGVDSAIVASIAKDALGSENVHSIMMPSKYTADISLIDAHELASNLGISYEIIPIKEIYASFVTTIENKLSDIALENLQARIRGNILMSYSNTHNALLISTGNKSELATGYCTLYGDMCGAFALIKDLTKLQVYALCEYYNELHSKKVKLKHTIPLRILTRAPSAELRDNQTDQDNLPDYAILDAIVTAYIEKKMSIIQIASIKINEKLIGLETSTKIVKLIKINEHKRRQGVIGPKISSCSFDKDWRYNICDGFFEKIIN
jgi:NAD+ synthase (glutamine-hydrolysing)